MMPDVRGSKLNGWPCYCHGAKHKQDALHHGMCLETAMRQHTVEARRQAEGGERVHCSQECQIGPVDGALP